MSNPVDLVSLSQVKSWLNITTTDQDGTLGSLITSVSRVVLNDLARGPTLAARAITEIRNGTGTDAILLRFWPVIAVTTLTVNGTIYNAQTDSPFGSGFYWDQWTGDDTQGRQRLYNEGMIFGRFNKNVVISYVAGYQAVENFSIASGSITYTTIRPWFSDSGVVDANTGQAFVAVPDNPTTGQYSVTGGVYTFAVADEGRQVNITYSYTPEDLQQAVIDEVAWKFKNRDRIGMVSKGLAGETTTFSQKRFSESTDSALQPFRDVSPL